ncbi:protein neprosin-like [Tasmannia lanceolata]|uniref:protein neprosin-like n=1 Tax=Tasmannia lanceolata TaxID=3420 RepID=UPI00406369E0
MKKKVNANDFSFKWKMVLLSMVFMALGTGVNGRGSVESIKQKDLEVVKKLKQFNKPAVKTIQSGDGDIIDCVDIYKQPTFDHPHFKNHTIQMRPSFNLERIKEEASASSTTVSQVWQKSGSCPEGTIPIRRVKKRDLLRSPSLETYGKKNPHVIPDPNTTRSQATQANEMYPTGILITDGYSYNGAEGDINVWNPNVESPDEYTTAKISLRNGPYYSYSALEAGWMVNPGIYGDKRSRLFAYWTKDGGKTTGCVNLLCPGFVQVSTDIVLGSALEPTSIRFGAQYQISLSIARDPDTESWWLIYGGKTPIGYWMPSVFTTAGSSVIWGGEVYTKKLGNPHTATQMGSGDFAERGYGFACFMRNIRIRDNSLVWKYPAYVTTYENQFRCYNAFNFKEYIKEPEFYFGGPGRNDLCP